MKLEDFGENDEPVEAAILPQIQGLLGWCQSLDNRMQQCEYALMYLDSTVQLVTSAPKLEKARKELARREQEARQAQAEQPTTKVKELEEKVETQAAAIDEIVQRLMNLPAEVAERLQTPPKDVSTEKGDVHATRQPSGTVDISGDDHGE